MQNHERNSELTRRIQQCEQADKGGYFIYRSALDYAKATAGALMSALENARRINRHIAIIGIGSGRAAQEIAAGKELVADGSDLEILTTGLTSPLEEYQMLGANVQFVLSPVEELADVRVGQTFGAVIGVNSVAYALPDVSVDQIDQALILGGVFLGTFRNPQRPFLSKPDDLPDFETADPFIVQFQQRGYDIATTVSEFMPPDFPVVLLAIKPGGQIRAKTMLLVAQARFGELYENLQRG